MEMGGGIFRRIDEAILVPDVRVSRTSKKPPSRYGFIKSHGQDLFPGRSNRRNVRKIS
jgi:hypothetical protein